MKKLFFALIIAAGLVNAGSAQAVSCGTTGGLDTSNVQYSVSGAAPFTNSTDCAGVILDNINSASDITQFGGGFSDVPGTITLFGGSFTFALSGAANAPSGTYILTATDDNGGTPPNFPITIDLAIALKASDRYAVYFFDDITFDGSGGGPWTIVFLNNGGQIPNLSHLLAGVREGTGSETPGETPGEVPEPTGLILFGTGLLAMAGAAKKLKRKN